MDIDDQDIALLQARRAVRGRGTGNVPKGRFETTETVYGKEDVTQVKTELFKDSSRSILAFNESPDVGFSASMNPYRGCEHGCIYCYARPTHEYLGLSAGLDFETKIFAKMEAPVLLQQALSRKSWKPQPIGISGVTDCYQPLEKKLELTRQCLQVLAEFRNPCVIITKHHLVTRDIDILERMAAWQGVHVVLSVTTLDPELSRRMEPRASVPSRRLEAIRHLRKSGIPVSVNVAPVIPGLTDHEIPEILRQCKEAGALNAHYVMLRLPYGVKDLFAEWLESHYPLRKEKVLHRIRDVRGGALYDSAYGNRMTGEGFYAEQIAQLFSSSRARYGINLATPALNTQAFVRPQHTAQLSLF